MGNANSEVFFTRPLMYLHTSLDSRKYIGEMYTNHLRAIISIYHGFSLKAASQIFPLLRTLNPPQASIPISHHRPASTTPRLVSRYLGLSALIQHSSLMLFRSMSPVVFPILLSLATFPAPPSNGPNKPSGLRCNERVGGCAE